MRKIFLLLFLCFIVIVNALGRDVTFISNSEPQTESEHLVVFTDRDIYVAGEEALVSLRLVHSDKASFSNIAYIVLRKEDQNIVSHTTAKLSDGKFKGSFYLSDTLSSGYYEILAYTNYLKNFGEESYSSKQIFVVNRFDKSYSTHFNEKTSTSDKIESNARINKYLDIEMISGDYSTHEKVKFKIKSKSQNSIINIAIVPKHSVIRNNSRFNSLLITQKGEGYCYPKEIDGVYLSGLVIDKDQNTPLKNARIFLSTPDSFVNIKYTSTDTLGRFFFHLSYPYFGRNVFIMPDSSSFEGDAKVLIDNRFNIIEPFIAEPFTFTDSVFSYINKSQDVVRVNKSYKQDLYSKEFFKIDSFKNIPRLYSSPNFIYNLSDYVPLDDFREIAREIIPYLKIRGRSGNYSFSMVNGNTSFTFFETAPALFINGVPLFNPDTIVDFGSNEISRIEILNLPWYYGDIKFNGILSIYLNESVDINSMLIDNVTIYSLDSFANETLYKEIDDINKLRSGVRPDFRQVLFWEPNVDIQSNSFREFEFYTSHFKGDYIIVVEGYTESGDYIRETGTFEVKK